jgi:hypothetical protein
MPSYSPWLHRCNRRPKLARYEKSVVLRRSGRDYVKVRAMNFTSAPIGEPGGLTITSTTRNSWCSVATRSPHGDRCRKVRDTAVVTFKVVEPTSGADHGNGIAVRREVARRGG